MKLLRPTTLIPAPHLGTQGVLEVDSLWQDSQTLALICHPNPKAGGDMTSKVVTTLFGFGRDTGMNVVRFNYRGVGRSGGQIQYGDGEFVDTCHVLHWAVQQTGATRLWLAGFSFGGFVACRVADKILTKPMGIALDRLILIAPSIEKNDPTGLKLDGKRTLIIYGDKDEFVSPDSMAKFAHEFGLSHKIIPDATHFFHGKLSHLKATLER